MRHLKVTDSDMIESVGYDPSDYKGTSSFGAMEIVFKASPNEVYRYEDVPGAAFLMLVSAPSIGKQFAEKFKKSKHPFTKSVRVVNDMINDMNKAKK